MADRPVHVPLAVQPASSFRSARALKPNEGTDAADGSWIQAQTDRQTGKGGRRGGAVVRRKNAGITTACGAGWLPAMQLPLLYAGDEHVAS